MSQTHHLLTLNGDPTERIGWHTREAGRYDTEYALRLTEPGGTEPHRMLAAIPSPFARLHVFDLALGFVSDSKRELQLDSVFHKVASQCLDALELLYNWQTHINSGFQLRVVRWDGNGEIETLRKSSLPEHRILADALGLYLSEDQALGAARSETWILAADEGTSALAVSSPLTIVAPAPGAAEVAKRLNLKIPGQELIYFEKVRSLMQRGPAFRAYLDRLFKDGSPLRSKCPKLFKHIQTVKKGTTDFAELARFEAAEYVDIAEGGASLTVHGHPMFTVNADPVPDVIRNSRRRLKTERGASAPAPILLVDGYDSKGEHRVAFRAPRQDPRPIRNRSLPDFMCPYPYVVENDFFEDFIIKVKYPLDVNAFVLPKDGSRLETAFLPPLKPAYFEFFSEQSVESRLTFTATPAGGGVRCGIEIPLQDQTIKLSRTYYPQPQTEGAGKIIEEEFSLAAFPAVSWSRPVAESHSRYVDERSFVLIETKRHSTEPRRTELRFFKIGAEGAVIAAGTSQVSEQERPGRVFTSKHYSLREFEPDLVQVAVDVGGGTVARSLFAPRTVRSRSGNKPFILAIDFGTTNSHLALADVSGGDANPIRYELLPSNKETGQKSVATLHSTSAAGSYIAEMAEQVLFHEFVPSFVGETRLMPTRTAISERPGGASESLFLDGNIAFFLYRDQLSAPDLERIHTRLKWARRNDGDVDKRIRLFFRELLVLARSQILLAGGDPSKTQLLWFWPLSFTEHLRATLDLMWQEEGARVLDIRPDAVKSLTESAAPYYYHEASARAVSDGPVLSIDVGGGSTDVVFFDRKIPKFGTSFHFAGNALWGSGFTQTTESGHRNGVARLVQKLFLKKAQELEAARDTKGLIALKEVSDGFFDNPDLNASEEIVNLGFQMDEIVHLSDALRKTGTVQLMALLHYSAIIFHCGQLMRALGLGKPQLVSLSGNGSKSLSILDVTPEKRFLAAHTAWLLDVVFTHWDAIAAISLDDPDAAVQTIRTLAGKAPTSETVRMLVAERLKEATCEGGIYWHALSGAKRADPEAYVLVSGAGQPHVRDDAPRYSEIGGTQIQNAADTFRRFIAIFRALSRHYDRFGLSETIVANAMPLLWKEIPDALNTGLARRRLSTEGEHERAVETLFFYPLVHKLWQVSQGVD